MAEGFVRFLYRSLSVHPDFHQSDIDILRTALRFNAAHGITGYLVRGDDQFFQALHGPEEPVSALAARIARDPRHSGVETLLFEPDGGPSPFAGWVLGYDHFLPGFEGVALARNGARPSVDRGLALRLYQGLAEAAAVAARYGSGFPQARRPGESDPLYLARLEQQEWPR